MTIKLKGSSNGSVSLVAPADTSPSGTDVSLTLPTTAGTAGQVLKNSSTAGTLEFGDLTTGKILQVVQSVKTDVDSSVVDTAFTDMGLSVSITPSSATSKVLVLVHASIGAAVGYDQKTRLVRNSTPIFIGDAASLRPRATTSFSATYRSDFYAAFSVTISYLDSPATTSATTYKLQGASYAASTMYLNRGPNDTDLAGYEARTASSIIAMEVEA